MTYTDEQIRKAVGVMVMLGWTTEDIPRGVGLRPPDAAWLPAMPYLEVSRNDSHEEVMRYEAEILLARGYFDAVAWRLVTHPKWLDRARQVRVTYHEIDGYYIEADGCSSTLVFSEGSSLVDATLDLLLAVLPMLEGE